MNLHSIVSGAVQAVNPFVLADIQISNGYSTNSSGQRIPIFKPTIPDVPVQVQPMSTRNLAQIENLNLQDVQRKIYIGRKIDGVVRITQNGGDIIRLKTGEIYLVTQVLEQWADWSSCAATLQNGV